MIVLFFQLTWIVLFSLSSCSVMDSSKYFIPKSLADVPLDAMRVISSYSENPFNTLGSLNKHFNELFSTQISVKIIFKERFNIPELIEDDIDNNEKELKYIISSFSKFHNPDHIYQALRNAFLYGNKFDVLIPKLMKYFDRIDPKRCKSSEVYKLANLKKFDYLFQQEPESFNQIHDCSEIGDLQEYFSANPDLLDRFTAEIASDLCYYDIKEWINTALITNMPYAILKALPLYHPAVFNEPHCIWSKSSIPIDQYPEMFEKINFVIDNMSLSNNGGSNGSSSDSSSTSDNDSGSENGNGNDSDNGSGSGNENDNFNDSGSSRSIGSSGSDNGNGGSTGRGNLNDNFNDSDSSASSGSSSSSGEDDIEAVREHYRTLNHIRFGPEDSNIYDEKIKNKTIPIELKILIFKSAFLTNKMDLYFKLLPEIAPKLTDYDYLYMFQFRIDGPINSHKLFFRVHEFANQYFSQTLHNSSLFLELASKYYRVIYCKFNGLTFESVLKILPDYIGSGFPESITIYRKYDDIYDSKRFVFKEMIFDNAELLEKLIVNIEQEFFYFSIEINVENLRLVMGSESIQLFMRLKLFSFLISPYSLFEVLEMPITTSLANIVRVYGLDKSIPLYDFKTTEQLSRLEILLGKSVSTLLKPEYDYFRYRHVFKYLIEFGNPLPVDLSDNTRALLEIDFPSLKFNL